MSNFKEYNKPKEYKENGPKNGHMSIFKRILGKDTNTVDYVEGFQKMSTTGSDITRYRETPENIKKPHCRCDYAINWASPTQPPHQTDKFSDYLTDEKGNFKLDESGFKEPYEEVRIRKALVNGEQAYLIRIPDPALDGKIFPHTLATAGRNITCLMTEDEAKEVLLKIQAENPNAFIDKPGYQDINILAINRENILSKQESELDLTKIYSYEGHEPRFLNPLAY
jgi:hypothetical protein